MVNLDIITTSRFQRRTVRLSVIEMGFVKWIGVILATCAILAATGLSNAHFYFFGTVCFLALVTTWRYTLHDLWNQCRNVSTRPSGATEIGMDASKLNDSLHELHKPQGDPGMQILFFHGLQDGKYEDAHLSTWKSGDGKCIWPKTWLVEKYDNAHVLTVSYNGGILKRDLQGHLKGAFRMYVIVENLISDLMQEDIGQRLDCPVILVGHSFGGLVIKQLCVQAFLDLHLLKKSKTSKREKEKLKKFLANVKGIFYYSTPHHGSPSIDELAASLEHPLLKYFKTLSAEAEALNFTFDKLRSSYSIRTHGLGESLPAQTGLFQGVVGVPEPSARDGDTFNVVEADHIQICRPDSKTDRRFYGLTSLIDNIVHDLEDARILRDTGVQQEERPQAKARTIEGIRVGEDEAQSQNFLHQPRHVTVPGNVQFRSPVRETLVHKIPEEIRLQQIMRALPNAQFPNPRHFIGEDRGHIRRPIQEIFKFQNPRHVVVEDCSHIRRPTQEISDFQNPRHVVVEDRDHIRKPMHETSRGLHAPREQLGKTAIDSTRVTVQGSAHPQQTQDDARRISTCPSKVVLQARQRAARILRDTSIQQEAQPQEIARVWEGTRVGEETWALKEAQLQTSLHQPRHVAVLDSVQFQTPVRETSVDIISQDRKSQQVMLALPHAQFRNPRHVIGEERGYIRRPMQETSRGLHAPREQLGRTAIDSTTVMVQRPAVPRLTQINDNIYQVQKPGKLPSIDIVFFHGLQLEGDKEVYLTTWLSAEGSELWPTWILNDFPDARILLVSYDAFAQLKDEQGRMENLVQSLTDGRARVGGSGCPVILVGHSVGCLVIKKLCCLILSTISRLVQNLLKNLLRNVKGCFFFACPHHESWLADDSTNFPKGPLFEGIRIINEEARTSNHYFRDLRVVYGWKTWGLGEGRRTTLRQFKDFKDYIVPEASARYDMDEFYTYDADHFNVCRPRSTSSSNFVQLLHFIRSALKQDLAISRVVVDADRYSRL